MLAALVERRSVKTFVDIQSLLITEVNCKLSRISSINNKMRNYGASHQKQLMEAIINWEVIHITLDVFISVKVLDRVWF